MARVYWPQGQNLPSFHLCVQVNYEVDDSHASGDSTPSMDYGKGDAAAGQLRNLSSRHLSVQVNYQVDDSHASGDSTPSMDYGNGDAAVGQQSTRV